MVGHGKSARRKFVRKPQIPIVRDRNSFETDCTFRQVDFLRHLSAIFQAPVNQLLTGGFLSSGMASGTL